MQFNIKEAEEKIKYTFKNKELLKQAFTHSSFSNENNAENNERMEHLGDALLNFVITALLYKKYPQLTEGYLTEKRAALVKKEPLSNAVFELELNSLMLLGEGEKKSAQKNRKLAGDLFESVTAAIYLDGGFTKAANFIKYALKKQIEGGGEVCDYKSELSRYCQKHCGENVKNIDGARGQSS